MRRFWQANMYRLCGTGVLLYAALMLCACATSRMADDAFDGSGPALTMVAVNHADRYAMNIYVDKYWAGNVDQHGGGAAGICCYPGVKDWSKPVTVKWTWGQESDTQTKVVLKPREEHTVVAHFPSGGPLRSDDMYKDEANLCIILRDADRAELAFSVTRSGCFDK
jgi:Protein of unknown function (DUF3304)